MGPNQVNSNTAARSHRMSSQMTLDADGVHLLSNLQPIMLFFRHMDAISVQSVCWRKMLDKLIELGTKYFSLDQEEKEHYTEHTTREFEEEHPGAVSMEDVIALDIYQLSDEVFGWERYSSAPEVAGFVERTGG